MKRLLLVTTSYPDQNEGAAAAGSFVADFAAELVRQNVAVTVVAPARAASVVSEQGVDVRRFDVPWLPLSTLSPMRPAHWAPIARTLMAGQRAVDRACADRSFDHILALWALPSGAWAMRAGQRLGIPYSTWALGSDIWSLGRLPVVRTYLRRVLREAGHRFADGYGLAADVQTIAERPCEFLASSRNLTAQAPRHLRDAAPYRLTYLGRWHPNKGVDILLDALELLNDTAWAAIERVRIFGGGPLHKHVHGQAAKLIAAGRPIEVGGYLEREGAIRLLEETDYLLLPSRIESIPVVFSDAMQRSCPIIATPVGDLPRLLEHDNLGALATAADAPAFAEAMRRILKRRPQDFAAAMDHAAESFRVESSVTILIERLFGREGTT